MIITPILFSVFLQLATSSSEWLPNCGATQRQKLLDLINTDAIFRHLTSGDLNSTLTECSNFHRHICPKQGISSAASYNAIFDQIIAIERPCTKYDVFTKIEKHFAFAKQFDHFDYSNKAALSALLFLMPKSTLITIYEFTTLHAQDPLKFFSNVWDRRHWNADLDQAKFPAKYDASVFTDFAKRKVFVDWLAKDIWNITETSKGVRAMTDAYLPFIKDVTDFNHIVNLLYREGFEEGAFAERPIDPIIKIAEEYGRVLKTATWSSLDSNGKTRYDRFYDHLMDIYNNTLDYDLRNMGPKNASLTFSRDFYNFYLEERNKLSSLAVLPFLRNFIAVNRAHERTLATASFDMTNRWLITISKTPNALHGYYVWFCLRNMAMSSLINHNSPDGALWGAMGYGHELYHGVERELYLTIMPNSPVVNSSHECVESYFKNVGLRFPGDVRFIYWPMEEEADLFGAQIAYGAFKNAMGNRIDDLAYPSLGITHGQLYFYANSIFACNFDERKINTVSVAYDGHYQVNGRLGQLPDFQSTFQCSAIDNMISPGGEYCPIFFPTYTE